MTIGVLWEFLEFGGDQLVRLDTQKDWIVDSISSVKLNPDGENIPVKVDGIACTVLYDESGSELLAIEGGYLDIGLIDTMKDLLVNLVGAAVFSIFGCLCVYRRNRYRFARHFKIICEDASGSGFAFWERQAVPAAAGGGQLRPHTEQKVRIMAKNGLRPGRGQQQRVCPP